MIATPTFQHEKTNMKIHQTHRNKDDYQGLCRDQTITHQLHHCRTNHHKELHTARQTPWFKYYKHAKEDSDIKNARCLTQPDLEFDPNSLL
jgi:hypothetical protein